MLRSQFKNGGHPDDNVLKVSVLERLSLPLVFSLLRAPEFTSHFGDTLLPAAEDPHALVQLQADVGERCLPDVSLLELTLNPLSEHSSGNFEKVLHSSLRVLRVDVWVLPDVVEGVLGLVNKCANLT